MQSNCMMNMLKEEQDYRNMNQKTLNVCMNWINNIVNLLHKKVLVEYRQGGGPPHYFGSNSVFHVKLRCSVAWPEIVK